MKIRFATIADSDALLNIYSQYINTPITFEYVLPTQQEFADRIRDITFDYPYLVCESEGTLIGYAYAHRHMERVAYQWNVELSIYIDQNYTSKGIGKKLYLTLFELLKLQGVRNVYAGVTLPNEKSERLHRCLGFSEVGIYHNTGYKSGKWQDVIWFEKSIAPYGQEPTSILWIREVEDKKIRSILGNRETI